MAGRYLSHSISHRLLVISWLCLILLLPFSFSAGLDESAAQAEGLLQEIQADLLAGQLAQAERQLEAAREFLAQDADFHYLWAVLFYQQQKFASALLSLERALSLAPDCARYYLLRGRIHEALGNHAVAKRAYDESLEVDPGNVSGVLSLVRLLERDNEAEEALSLLTEALHQAPKEAELHLQRGRLQEVLGRVDQAERSYQQALELEPALAEAHGRLGVFYREQRQMLARSAKHLREATKLGPQDPQWHYELGGTYQEMQDWEAAESSLKKTVELSPEARQAYYKLAQVYRERGQTEKARAAQQRFSELAREREEGIQARARLTARYKRAQALESDGRLKEAIAQYEDLLTVVPGRPEVFFALARAYLNAGRFSEAEGHIQQALKRQPNEATFHELYAAILSKLGRATEAIRELRTAVWLKPLEHELHNTLGNLLLEAEEVKAAISAYKHAVELAPEEPVYRANLSAAYRQRGEEEAARREWEKYKKLIQKPLPKPQ